MSSTSSSTPTSPQTPLNSPVLSQSSDFSPILSPLSPRRVGQSIATLSPARKVLDPSTIQSKHSYNPNTPPFEYKQVPQTHSHSQGVRGSSHSSEDVVFDREIWNTNFVQHLSSYPPPTSPINSIVDNNNRVPTTDNFVETRVSQQNTEKSSSSISKPSFGYSQLPSVFSSSPWNESSPNTNPPLFNLDQQPQNTTTFSRYFPNPPNLRTNVSPIWGLFAPAELKADQEGSNSNFSPLISPNDPISSNLATANSNSYSRKSVPSTSPTFISTPFVTNLLRPRGDRDTNWDTSSLISTIATASQSIALTTESDIEEENNIGGISSVEFDYSQLDEDDQELIEASSSILDPQSDDRRKALGLDNNTSTKTKGGFVSIFERTQQLANRYMSLGFPKDLVLCAIEACGDNPASVAAWLYSYQSQFLQQPLNRSSPITSPSPSPILTPISTLRSSGGLFASEGSAFAAPIERTGKRSFSRNPFSEATETNEKQQEDPEKRNIFFGFRPYYASSPNGLDDLSFEGTVDDGFRTGYFDLDLDGEKVEEEAGPPSVPICRFYVQGYCKNASKCAFYHPPKHPLVSPTPPSPTANATSTSPTDVSNVICRFHTAGNCKKGKNCPYLHPEGGFRPAHNSSPPPRSSPSPHSHSHTTYSYPVPRSPKISDFFPPTLSEKEKKHARHGSDSHSRKGSPIPDNVNEEKEKEGISSRRSPIMNDQKEDQSVNDIGFRKGRTSVGLKPGNEFIDSEIGYSDGLKQKASKAYRLGVHLYHEGQFEKALQFLRSSYENFPSKEAQSVIQQAEDEIKKRELERERKKKEDEEKLRAEKERKKIAEREEKERKKKEEEERKIKEEIERREKEREEKERERKERERKEREREEKERERKEKEREEKERKEKEKKEKERKKKEKAELEKREKLEKERLEKERLEVEKRERLERQKLETELREKEARERSERERVERKEREGRERDEGERKERESANMLAAEKLEREKIEREEKNLIQRVHSNEGADRPRTFSIEYTAGVPGMPGSDNLYNTESEEGRNDSDLENEGMPDLMSEEERSPSPPTREEMPPLISDRDDDEQSTESDHSNSNSGEEEDEDDEGDEEGEDDEEEGEYDGGSKNQGWISWLFGWNLTEDFSSNNDPVYASPLDSHIHSNNNTATPQVQQPTKPSSTAPQTSQPTPDQLQAIKKVRNATNHYQVLDLQQPSNFSDQFPNPSFEEIEKQYHRIAEKLHPKRNPAPDAKDAYYSLTLAYNVLSDPASRKGYDDALAKKTGAKSMQTKVQPQSYPRSLSNPTLSNTDTPPFVRTKISRRRIVPSWKAHSSSSHMKGKWLLTRWTLYLVRFSLSLFVLALWCIFIGLKWVFGGVAALYFTFKYRKHMKWCRSCGEYHAVGGQGSFYEEDGRYYFIKEGVRHDVSDLVNNRAFLSHTLSHHPHYASYLSHSHSHSHPHWYDEEDFSEGESENSSEEEIELNNTNPTTNNKNTKKRTPNAIANPTTAQQPQHGKKKSKGKKKR